MDDKWVHTGILVTDNGSEFKNEEFAKCPGLMG